MLHEAASFKDLTMGHIFNSYVGNHDLWSCASTWGVLECSEGEGNVESFEESSVAGL
jgi:hypothetical protein